MAKISVTLTATNCFEALSKDAPEADFDAWVAFVARRNPDWTVTGDFSERVCDNEVDAEDVADVRESIQSDWDAFCADASAWPARDAASGCTGGVINDHNLDAIVALDLREVASDALREGYTLTLHRLRGCDVRPDWSETDGVELLICSAGFVAAAANGGAKLDCSSPMLRKSSDPATIAWWIFRHDAETATGEENAAAREYGEQWARTQFDALVEESSRVLSDHAAICGPWNRHTAGFPECADGVAEKAARAEWARLVEEEAVS